MKRIGNLYHLIWDVENIKLAHKNARKGKAHYREVKEVDADVDYYCNLLSEMLKNKTFVNSAYEVFTKMDKGKEREIYRLPYFPDRIVHHAILQVLEPIWKSVFINNTYQSIKGRGVHRAKKHVEEAIKMVGEDAYYLQMDIRKFYPSVDNNKMKIIIAKKIKCKDTLWLLYTIIDSTKGLPIGNYLSQYLGNLYLSYFDHYVKEKLKVKHYFRYCDDLVIIGNSTIKLKEVKLLAIRYLTTELGLEAKPNVLICSIGSGLDFLGFVFKGSHTLLRKTIANSYKGMVINYRKTNDSKAMLSAASYNGWLIAADTYNLRSKYPLVRKDYESRI